jgi:hypothetical protein
LAQRPPKKPVALTTDELVTAWQDFLHVAPESDVPEVLYHYTSAAGLLGVLQNKSLLASDRHFLNDRTEVSQGRDRATKVIRKDLQKRQETAVAPVMKKTCELINYDDGARHFIFSMSERDDDLSQWRGYANEGDGYTIGLDGTAILESATPSDSYGFNRVSYSGYQFDQSVREITSQFSTLFETRGGEVDDVAGCLSAAIEAAACYHKHTSFRYEREWRIVNYAYPPYEEVEVRESSGRIIPFIRLPLRVDEVHIPIRRIGIGPSVRNPNVATAIKDLCRICQVDAEIYNAASPFVRY